MKRILEIVIFAIILSILVVFLMPTKLLMPDTVNTMLVMILIVAFLAFISMVYKEQPKDERDKQHILLSGRISYISGILVLMSGIVFQAFTYEIDPWLIYSILVMVLTKLVTRVYFEFKN